MKIGYTGVNLPEGKVRFEDETLDALATKDNPKKVSPHYVELIPDEFTLVDAIVVAEENMLDFLILDMEKIETRMERLAIGDEKALLARCLESLENDVPLCDMPLSVDEKKVVESAAPYSLKPVLVVSGDEDVNAIIEMALQKAGLMFFYTSGPKESHAWLVKEKSDIVTCAAKIHTALAKGFIRGDVVSFEDYMKAHSFNDCKAQGLAKLADRDYIIQPREIIEIRFNVSR